MVCGETLGIGFQDGLDDRSLGSKSLPVQLCVHFLSALESQSNFQEDQLTQQMASVVTVRLLEKVLNARMLTRLPQPLELDAHFLYALTAGLRRCFY